MTTTQSSRTRAPRRSWGKIKRLPSGRYRASYSGPDLARHAAPHTFTAKMDAEHWLADERRLIDRDEWTPPRLRAECSRQRGRTFGSYADDWLATRTLKPKTRALYRGLLDGPLAKLTKVPLALLTADTVRRWHASLPADRATRNAHAYSLLHAILNTAVGDGLLTGNPANVRGAMAAKTERKPVILSPNEITKVALSIQPPQLKAMVLISAWCGLRYGEVSELRRKDFRDDCSVVDVARGVTHTFAKGVGVQCHISTPKSGRGRAIVVPPHIRADLVEHLAAMGSKDPEALVFTPIRGCHFNEKTARKSFHDALKAIGREGVNLHDLRHFAGSQAARVGNLKETMDRLGHSTVNASLRYQHSVSGRDAEIAEALSALAGLTPEELADAETGSTSP